MEAAQLTSQLVRVSSSGVETATVTCGSEWRPVGAGMAVVCVVKADWAGMSDKFESLGAIVALATYREWIELFLSDDFQLLSP